MTAAAEPKLMQHQVDWVADQAKVAIWEKSRRIGADYCEAFRAVRDRIAKGNTADLLYMSQREETAREFMEYVAFFAQDVYGQALKLVNETEVFSGRDVQVYRVYFPGGAKIIGLTSAPAACRGFGGDVTLSEYAFHSDADELWKAVWPCVTWGGKLRVLSSHNGLGSAFNRRLDQARRHLDPQTYGEPRSFDIQASLHRTTIHDACANGLVDRINAKQGTAMTVEQFLEECRRGAGDERAWLEEYCCQPSVDECSYFPFELLRPAVRDDDPRPASETDAFVDTVRRRADELKPSAIYAGCDIGRKSGGDKFVIWVIGLVGGMRRTLGALRWTDRPFDRMEDAITRLMRSDFAGRRPLRIAIDETGLGMQLAERMRQQIGPRVEPVTFSAPMKVELVTLLRRDLEEATVSLPDDDETLRGMNSIRRTLTAAGNPRYVADDEGGHADEAMAVALALHCADDVRGSARWAEISERDLVEVMS